MLDIRQLRYFIEIVERGSLSRASVELRIAQPALSLHVKHMEEALGIRLLVRTSRGVVPTEAGNMLVVRARQVLQNLAEIESDIRGAVREPTGEVRLGLPGTISEFLSVPLITAVYSKYPKIKLRISEAMSGFVLNWMRENRIDLAILYGKAEGESLNSTLLFEEELRLFGPSVDDTLAQPPLSKPVRFSDAVLLPMILPSKGHGLRDLLSDAASEHELQINSIMDIDSYTNIKMLVRNGFGYTILPGHSGREEEAAGTLQGWQIHEPRLHRQAYLAHSVERPMTHALTAVMDLIPSVLDELIASGQWKGTIRKE